MKKLTIEYKKYLLTKSKHLVNRQLKITNLISKRKRALKKKNKAIQKTQTKSISAPENFVLGYTNEDRAAHYPVTRLNLLNFIRKIKHSLENENKVHISFKNTKWLAPSGTLIFVAELERILTKYPGKVTCDYPNDEVVEQLFQHIGLLGRLGLTSRKAITAENVRHWNYVYGTNVDTTEFKSLFTKYSSEISEEVRSGLFDSMSEAVTNSIQHAYPCDHKNNNCTCVKSWWMFAKQTEYIPIEV